MVVDFWAEWCPPCVWYAPTIELLARSFAGRALVTTVDVDGQKQLAERYGVTSVPSVLFFKQGQVVGEISGALTIEQLRAKLDGILSTN